MVEEKPIHWLGSSYRDVVRFPEAARRSAGYQLGMVQNGLMPLDWKPMESVGPGAYEIRVSTRDGGNIQQRVFYVAKFDEAVYVLHAFEKKTQATPRHDIDVGRARYAEMLRERQTLSKKR